MSRTGESIGTEVIRGYLGPGWWWFQAHRVYLGGLYKCSKIDCNDDCPALNILENH